MRNVLLFAVVIVISAAAQSAEARRLPRRSFRPVVGLTDARVDLRFHLGPMPLSRDQQLLPLPSFAAPPGYLGLHGSIWQAVRHYDWQKEQLARPANGEHAEIAERGAMRGPRTILFVRRPPTSERATTRPSVEPTSVPLISSVRIVPGLDG